MWKLAPTTEMPMPDDGESKIPLKFFTGTDTPSMDFSSGLYWNKKSVHCLLQLTFFL